MNVRKIHRPLAATAVTGALVLGAPGLAQADDSDRSSADQQFSSPLEVGGLTLDSRQQDSSQDRQHDSDDGDREGSATQDRSSTDYRFDSGSVTADPNGSFHRDSASTEDDGDASSEYSKTEVDGGLPLDAEGPSGGFRQHEQSRDRSFDSDEDGSSAESSEQSTTRQGSFDLGSFEFDPSGAFFREDASRDDGDNDSAEASRNWAELGSPYDYSGGHGGVSQDQYSEDASADHGSDGSESNGQSSHSREQVGTQVGEASGDPGAWVLDESAQYEDGEDSAQAGHQRFGYDTPFSVDGFWTVLAQEQSSHENSTDDEEVSSADDDSHERRAVGFDGLSGHPQESYDTEDLQQDE